MSLSVITSNQISIITFVTFVPFANVCHSLSPVVSMLPYVCRIYCLPNNTHRRWSFTTFPLGSTSRVDGFEINKCENVLFETLIGGDHLPYFPSAARPGLTASK